jgi:hypothetical protein
LHPATTIHRCGALLYEASTRGSREFVSTGTGKGASFRNRKVLHLAGRKLGRLRVCGGFSRSEP